MDKLYDFRIKGYDNSFLMYYKVCATEKVRDKRLKEAIKLFDKHKISYNVKKREINKEDVDIRGLSIHYTHSKEGEGYDSIKRVVTNTNKYYKLFMKNEEISGYKKEIINCWINTEKLLRKMFKSELGKRCKECKSCCCKGCGKNGGHFTSFDYFMYKIRGFEYPKFKNYLGKKGCIVKKDRRSAICLFYTCGEFPLLILLKKKWEDIIDSLNESVIKGLRDRGLYNKFPEMGYIFSEISDKYNPLIKVDKKLMDKNTRKHMFNFRNLENSQVLNKDIKDSVKYIMRVLQKNLRDKGG